MKRILLKIVVFAITFILTVLIGGKIINKGHNNLTMEMSAATLPVVAFETEGIRYNAVFGYTQQMDVALMGDSVSILDENRRLNFSIDTFNYNIDSITMQVRNQDGSRLIENTEITDFNRKGTKIKGELSLKDLIEKDEEYLIVLQLKSGDEQIDYYTRAVWADKLYFAEKIEFILDFNKKIFDKEEAKEITKYLETNSSLDDNKSFNTVSIHSSFKQITWGDLPIKKETEPTITLVAVDSSTANVLLDYYVSTSSDKRTVYYRVSEYYRVRYTTDRIYLLDYQRTMNQIMDNESICVNDKLVLGIVDEDVQMMESEDGSVVVFEEGNILYSYNTVSNKLAQIFGFYNDKNKDSRCLNDNHSIKILDVDEGGNVTFAVYGYMNRGRHEGECGIDIYRFNSGQNTIEEALYIKSDKPYSILSKEVENLLYVNRENKAYIFYGDNVYLVDMLEEGYDRMITRFQDNSIQVADNHHIIVWQDEENIYYSQTLNVLNMSTGGQSQIKASVGEAIKPLGFMGEDIIYGIARKSDIVFENTGTVFFPMYKICINDTEGKLLKKYEQPGYYVTDASIQDNQITLKRVKATENGNYVNADDDHIMDNSKQEDSNNLVVAAAIDIYEKYVQIKVKKNIDQKTLKLLTPKEVVYEGLRQLVFEENDSESDSYYVYNAYGVQDIYKAPGKAVAQAYKESGKVIDNRGKLIWKKASRVSKNQIMAIKEVEINREKSSLSVCLDTVLSYNGIVKNSEGLLAGGDTALNILESSLDKMKILDLTGAPLDAVLYYVNQDIPVIAILSDGEAVLITGFNEFNTVIFNPNGEKGSTLYKKGMNDTKEWLEENGNRFITYTIAD